MVVVMESEVGILAGVTSGKAGETWVTAGARSFESDEVRASNSMARTQLVGQVACVEEMGHDGVCIEEPERCGSRSGEGPKRVLAASCDFGV